jgi:hypothetical protein
MKMKLTTRKLYWRIRGYDSSKPIFEKTVEHGQFTENQMKHLLMTLAAKAGLGYDHIVGAYATRRTKIANDFLIVHTDFKYPSLSCGLNPHFVASVVDENRKITSFPELNAQKRVAGGPFLAPRRSRVSKDCTTPAGSPASGRSSLSSRPVE